jgi:hypothetical protein
MRWLRRLTAGKVILFASALSLLVFVVWLAAIYLAWSGRGEAGAWDLWAMVEALSSAAAFATVIGGGVVVLAQLVESIDGRHLAVYNDLFAAMMSDAEIEARRFIYQSLPQDPAEGIAALDEEGRRKVKLVLNSLDRLGFLLKQDWVTADGIVEWVSPMVIKIWARLEAYIEYEAGRRSEPDYYSGVRYLAERCQAWRRKHAPGSVTWVDDAL